MVFKQTNDPIQMMNKLGICQDPNTSYQARAETLIYLVMENGLDLQEYLANLLEEADQGKQARKDGEEERPPLVPVRFMRDVILKGAPYAVVIGPQGANYLPCSAEEVEGLEFGDPVLIDPKQGRIVGMDGAVPPAGEVVPIESLIPDDDSQIVVKLHEQEFVAYVPAKLRRGERIEIGKKVLYDAATRFIHQVVNSHTDGEELLTDLDVLDSVSRENLGSPHPILDEILFRIQQSIQYPEWADRMGARESSSYLLSGPTGTGKTMHLKVMARELADFVEDLTGERISTLITVDANSFYSSLFGATENKIAAFFDRLRTLGDRELTTRDGDKVKAPVIVVLEECEALLRSRGEMGGSGHLFDRPLSMILQKISSLGHDLNMPVYFVATTNRPDLLDAAARRRIGLRHVVLGSLNAAQAAAVLATKLPASMKFRGEDSPEALRQEVISQVVNYLFAGDDAEQGVAEVRFLDNTRRLLCRRNLVTGAMIEEAVSAATDDCLKESSETGELLGIDAQGVIRSLESQYRSLAGTLRAHNLPEYCPEWFQDEPLRVEHVRPLINRARRPTSWAIH